MKSLIYILSLVLMLSSCSNQKKETKNEKENQASERLEIVKGLASKYDAYPGFDTLYFSMTYMYQDFLVKNKKVILQAFTLNDIVKVDTGYVFSLELWSSIYQTQFMDLFCTEKQFKELTISIGDFPSKYEGFYELLFVAQINSVDKIKYSIKSEIDSEVVGEDEEVHTVDLFLSGSNAILFKGKLLFAQKLPSAPE